MEFTIILTSARSSKRTATQASRLSSPATAPAGATSTTWATTATFGRVPRVGVVTLGIATCAPATAISIGATPIGRTSFPSGWLRMLDSTLRHFETFDSSHDFNFRKV